MPSGGLGLDVSVSDGQNVAGRLASRVSSMRTRSAIFVASIPVLLATGPVVAHHSFSAEFDANKPIRLTGVVTKVEWQNPHTLFYMDVEDESGKVANWGWEMASPNQLMRAGWTRRSMQIGDLVTVEGSHARDGSNYGNARVIVMTSTGKRLFTPSSQGQTP